MMTPFADAQRAFGVRLAQWCYKPTVVAAKLKNESFLTLQP